MKKLFVIIIMMLVIPFHVSAETEKSISNRSILSIDTENKYSVMESSYSNGYIPRETGENLRLILPLTSSDAIHDNKISISFDYGDTKTSPFTFTNIHKTIQKQSWTVNDGSKSHEVYLIDVSLPLSSKRINGTYPLTVNTTYTLPDGSESNQAFELYATITSGKTDGTQPAIIMQGYTLSSERANAGDVITFTIKLKSTGSSVAKNLKAIINDELNEITPVSHSSVFIEVLQTGQTKEITFKMKIASEIKPGVKVLTFSLGAAEKSESAALTEKIYLTVSQPVKLTFDPLNLPSNITSGESFPVTVTCYNEGKSTVYNIIGELRSVGLIPEGQFFIGNIEPGESKTVEVYVYAADKTYIPEGESPQDSEGKYGTVQGNLNITYENLESEKLSEKLGINTTIKAPLVISPKEDPKEKDNPTQWWVSVLILGIILTGTTTGIFIWKNIQKKRALYDEDE